MRVFLLLAPVLDSTPPPLPPLDAAGLLPAMYQIGDSVVALSRTPIGMGVLAIVLLLCLFEGLWIFLGHRG